jgi:bifunctional DNA-binding transcriptional regulator/antitoxin component of YhaV-PrlF toxin-antitoxin module
VLVPVALRDQLGIVPGEPMVARADEGKLVIERREETLRRLRGRFAAVPPGVSLVDELIRERRAEVELEERG